MTSLLKLKNILFNTNVSNKEEFFIYLGEMLKENKISNDTNQTILAIKERESIGSTGFESGIAIPHTRHTSIIEPTLLFIKIENGIDWNALDGNPTNIFFILLFPDNENSGDDHLQLLSHLAQNLMDENFIKNLNSINDSQKMLDLLKEKIFSNQEVVSDVQPQNDESKDYYLAVVACTFGIAHTYLAEQKLIKYAKEQNFNIKVETFGRKGNLNKITPDDLQKAKGVLIATDKEVDLSHIKHNNIYRVSTGFSIKNTSRCFDVLTGKIKISNFKEEIKQFVHFKLKQSCMFSFGKAHNYISKIAIIIGIFLFLSQFGFAQDFSKTILDITKFTSLIAIPVILGFFVYFFTKSETTSSTTAVTFFVIEIYLNLSNLKNLENDQWISAGVIGVICYSVVAIVYNRYVYTLNSKLFKKTKFNGLFKFIFQVGFVLIIGTAIYYSHNHFGWVNKHFYNGVMDLNLKYDWFNIIIAIVFFSLMVTDMGGPINKWTIILSTLFLVDSFSVNANQMWLTPITAQVVAITLPGIGAWTRGVVYKRIISENEHQKCMGAGKDAMNGISEGALWVLKKYKWKGYVWAYFNAIIAGFIIGFFNIQLYGGSNSIFGVIFGVSKDNVLQKFGLDYTSLNIGYLILMVITPLITGVLSIIFLQEKKIQK